MSPTDQQRDFDAPKPTDESGLRFSAGRFEDWILDLIFVLQLSLGGVAMLIFGIWVLSSPSSTGDWLLEILLLSIALGGAVLLLHQLYE